MPQDFYQYWEDRNKRNAEERYQTGLERSATGAGQLAQATGRVNIQDDLDRLAGRLARGGAASPRGAYLVGEKGPEVFIPEQDGTVVPNHKLQALLKALPRRAAGGPVHPTPEDLAMPSGFRNTGWMKIVAARDAAIKANDAALGSPQSYRGGALSPGTPIPEDRLDTGPGTNFSNPIQIIRGMQSTWQGPNPGEEFGSPLRANQAFNRQGQNLAVAAGTRPDAPGGGGLSPNLGAINQRYGGYEPPAGPEKRLEAELKAQSPESLALADWRKGQAAKEQAAADALAAANAEKTGVAYVNKLKNYVATTRGVPEKDSILARDLSAAEAVARTAKNEQAGIQHFEDRQLIRSHLAKNPLTMPQGYTIDMYLGALARNPAAWNQLVQEGRKALTAPAAAAPGQELPAMKQLEILGEKIAPDWMKPNAYKRYHPKE